MIRNLFFLGAFGIALGGAALGVGTLLCRPHRSFVIPPMSLGAAAVTFHSASGALLHGSWIAGTPQRPTIVLMHGVRADRRSLFQRAALFKKLGYNVLMFD